ncbi:MAG: hypothetical protein MRY83_23630 [Flavobacteriales bacterium]|nr:hypothetical protein [Flavobacteriales bacterium]
MGKQLPMDQAALVIGSHFKPIEDKLLNILQLKGNSDNSELIEASINQKIEYLNPFNFSEAISFKENKKYIKYILPPLLVFVLLYSIWPSVINNGTQRIVQYNEQFVPQSPFDFVIQNSSLDVVEHGDFNLNIKIEGDKLPKEAYIEFGNSKFKLKKGSANDEYSYTFKNVQKSTDFTLIANEHRSNQSTLHVIPKPVILNFDIALDYPSYIGKEDGTQQNIGDLIVPEGTTVNWKFKTKNTSQIQVNVDDSSYILNPINDGEFRLEKRFLRATNYYVKAFNSEIKHLDSLEYTVSIIKDEYPTVEVEKVVDTNTTKRYYFRGNIKDDYGFSKLVFYYRFLPKPDDESTVPDELQSDILAINKKTTINEFYHTWDLSRYDIQAGDRIEYYFEVWDNDGVNGAKSTKSKIDFFEAPTLDELEEKDDEHNQEFKNSLKESISDAQNLQKELEKLRETLLEKKKLSWEEKQKINDVLERQKELEKKISDALQKNEKHQNEQNEFRKLDPELVEKQKKLEELFEEIMTDEMKELYEEMQELMEKMDKDDFQNKIEEMNLSNEDIEKELDRALELFKQLEFEKNVQEAIDKIEELKEKQEDLAEQTENASKEEAEELKEKQDEINEEMDKLQEELSDLKKENEDLQFPNEMGDVNQESQEAKEKMQQSSEQLQKKQNKGASDSQKDAAKKLDEMAQKMSQSLAQMQQEAQEENLDDMRQLLENLVQLSFEQEEAMISLKGLDRKDPQYVAIAQKQRKLKDDAKLIEDSLFALSKRVVEIQPDVNRELNAINTNMEKAINLMTERKTPMVNNRQQLIMTSVNNLALLFDEIIQQMQQQLSEQKFGQGSCNKPGSSGKPSAMSLRKMQQQLNKQMEQMKKEMQKGKTPGQSGQGQKGGQSERLAKMAAEQEAIRNALKEMADGIKEGQNGKNGSGGDMNRLQELMEETERDIVNRRITEQTLNRQKEILTRLLESEKADRERGEEEQRESKEYNKEQNGNPLEYFEYNRKKEKIVELLRTVPPNLNPYYKKKVIEYFNTFDN